MNFDLLPHQLHTEGNKRDNVGGGLTKPVRKERGKKEFEDSPEKEQKKGKSKSEH